MTNQYRVTVSWIWMERVAKNGKWRRVPRPTVNEAQYIVNVPSKAGESMGISEAEYAVLGVANKFATDDEDWGGWINVTSTSCYVPMHEVWSEHDTEYSAWAHREGE